MEVYLNGTWGTICDNGWDIQDAMAVCHHLGYGTAVFTSANAVFGMGIGSIWYDNVRCSGSETNFAQCAHGVLGKHRCRHYEDVGVVCASE